MKSIATLLAAAAALALGACATTGSTTPGAQLAAWCPTAQSEMTAFQTVATELPADGQKAIAVAAPLIATLCSPASVADATAGNLTQFTQDVLPALTIIGVEYAALMNAKLEAAKLQMQKTRFNAAPVAGVL